MSQCPASAPLFPALQYRCLRAHVPSPLGITDFRHSSSYLEHAGGPGGLRLYPDAMRSQEPIGKQHPGVRSIVRRSDLTFAERTGSRPVALHEAFQSETIGIRTLDRPADQPAGDDD